MDVLAKLEKSVATIIHALIEAGIADRFSLPSIQRTHAHAGDLGFPHSADLSWALRDQPYGDLYGELLKREMFHVLLPDGGMLQYQYKVRVGKVSKHRLAFYPSPYLTPFDADVARYLQDSVWGHVVSGFHMPVVIRFDFDADERNFSFGDHSYSHLTLGQYPNCRIPVSSPVTPWIFTELVLKNFYKRGYSSVRTEGVFNGLVLPPSLAGGEEKLLHISVPD